MGLARRSNKVRDSLNKSFLLLFQKRRPCLPSPVSIIASMDITSPRTFRSVAAIGSLVMAGLWFDELEVGMLFQHAIRRTVTETDNLLFSALTHNPAQLHLDAEYMKGSEFGQILVNSTFTLGLMVGVSVGDTTLGTAIANLGWDEVRFPAPVFIGDTLRIETEVGELRPSRSRPHAGIVTYIHRAFNQRNELVASCKRSGLQRMKPA
jgi:acyl dehydratase